MTALRRHVERRALLLVISVAGWIFGESRVVLLWAERRLSAIEGQP